MEETSTSLEWLACVISKRGAVPLATFLVEAHRPLRGIGEALLGAGEFALKPMLGNSLFSSLQELLSSPEKIDFFLTKLEELEAKKQLR